MATLNGFAFLPADTFADGPQSGADNGAIDAIARIQPIVANGRTGPFDGQPVQGFSGVQFAPGSDGDTFWFLSDNGFGNEDNSKDYLLRLYQAVPSFNGTGGDGSVEIQGFVQLSDPNGLIPFAIQNGDTPERLLTGTDFDIESFVIAGNGDIWVGEEFGPYVLHFNPTGELIEAPIATPNPVDLNTVNGQDPLVIGHRGASGDFPEHTLQSYRAAIAGGADFIEPDLVITSDGVLIARHEPILDGTTNVAEVFGPERRATKNLDGVEVTAYFAEDFTLAEIKQLRAVERIPGTRPNNAEFNGLFEIPTFQEVIELVQAVEAETGVKVGIYPETKHPTFFENQGFSLEEPLIETLQSTGFTDPNRIFIQSFEIQNLIELQGMLDDAGLGDIPLVQLYGDTTVGANPDDAFSFPVDVRYNVAQGNDLAAIYGDLVNLAAGGLTANTVYGDLDSAEVLQWMADTYAEGVGPWKNNILLREPLATPVDGNGDGVAQITSQLTGEITSFLADAHAAGLQLHPYTLRSEEGFLTLNADGTPQTFEQEVQQLIQLGFDGFFTDFARKADPVRDKLVSDEVRSPQNPDFDFNSLNGQTPLVIGHRGASGSLPEHTLEGYRLAIAQGADFIEPDLVITKDGVLIARHEPILDGTTNVAEVFGPERRATKMLDGVEVTAYFAEDFTLDEIKQLRAKERIPGIRPDNAEYDGLFEIPTFQEVIELVQEVEATTGRRVGIYPETKHPSFFEAQGFSLEEPLIQTLLDTGFTDPNRIFIQSFEVSNLIDLRQNLLPAAGLNNLKLVQLLGDTSPTADPNDAFSLPYDFAVNAGKSEAELREIYGDLVDLVDFSSQPTYEDLANPDVINFISTYADGLGPWKNTILLREPLATPVDGNGDGIAEITSQLTGDVVPLIDWAHDAGLQVHPYTLRDEETFLTLNADGTPQTTGDEFRQLIELGVDGFFTDYPETGRIVVEQFEQSGDANLGGSKGYEGMAFSPDRQTLYPLLEGTVFGDPVGSLRIYEFDVASSSFEGLLGLYQMDAPNHAIGDFTPINDHEFLIIERDNGQGASADFKKIFKIDISSVDSNGFFEKSEVVDLMNIADPNDLNGDGDTSFTFPFVTIEDVLVLDETTLLVANDNNYPFSIGRDLSGTEIDNNEVILVGLDQPLNVDLRLGVAALSRDITQGTREADTLAGGIEGDDFIFGGDGDDVLRGDLNSRDAQVGIGNDDTIFGEGGNDRIGGKGGNDTLYGGAGDDQIWGDDGDDLLWGGLGNDTLTGDDRSGGQGSDTFVLAAGEGTDTITDFEVGIDFIGLAGGLSFGALAFSGNAISSGTETLAILQGVDTTTLDASAFVTV